MHSADAALRRALLGWFRRQGRALPWREAPSPYAVWASEVMLQQTQISTVIPYYNRFIGRFPTVERLAAAPLERVLELWSGLGYYRRARLMHKAARQMVARLGGRFPVDYHAARSLPGVGDYTARAVLSIAYNQPLAVLDGNVARVVARLHARKGNLQQKSFRRAVEDDLEHMLSRRSPGNFNQALMQVGQLVCLPQGPRCSRCPLRSRCQAHLLGTPEDFPEPRPRRRAELHFLAAAVVRRGDHIALVRGLDEGLLGDLWNFPSAFGRSKKVAKTALFTKVRQKLPRAVLSDTPSATASHSITHRRIHADVYLGDISRESRQMALDVRTRTPQPVDGSGKDRRNSIRWIRLSQFRRAAVSRLAQKIAAALSSPR